MHVETLKGFIDRNLSRPGELREKMVVILKSGKEFKMWIDYDKTHFHLTDMDGYVLVTADDLTILMSEIAAIRLDR